MLQTTPLESRDAFYGGRMGNVMTRHAIIGREKIRYVDMCFLYSYVLKTGIFSTCYLEIYVGAECSALIGASPDFDLILVEDLMRCKELAPREFYHPVVPFRARKKLLFALCQNCCDIFTSSVYTRWPGRSRIRRHVNVLQATQIYQKGLSHNSCERDMELQSHRIWSDYATGSLFADYINCFLQLRQETSGSSKCVNDEEAKKRNLRK